VKRVLKALWHIEENVRLCLAVGRFCHERVPLVGRFLGMFVDRTLLWAYGLDVRSDRIRVARLTIAHPGGVLLGGNGIVSPGRVAIMAGVKFVARRPDDPEFLLRHRQGDVFRLGDNVMIGANCVVVGPIEICDNVQIAAMSLVNRSIAEPGTYAGTPARRVDDATPSDIWVRHLTPPNQGP